MPPVPPPSPSRARLLRAAEAQRGAMLGQFFITYELSRRRLARITTLTPAAFSAFYDRVIAATERMAGATSAADAAAERGKIGCAAGCAACCHQDVLTTSSEAFRIALWLAEQETAMPDLAAAAAAVTGLGYVERLRRGIACAFLENARCGIYPVRPQQCRTHFSLSRVACETQFRHRHDPARAAAVAIPYLTTPKLLGEAIALAADCALHERGLQLVQGELAALVHAAVAPGAFAQWAKGDPIFPAEPAREYAEALAAMHRQAVAECPPEAAAQLMAVVDGLDRS